MKRKKPSKESKHSASFTVEYLEQCLSATPEQRLRWLEKAREFAYDPKAPKRKVA